MITIIDHTVPIAVFSAHCVQASRPEAEKQLQIDILNEQLNRYKATHIISLQGNMNARIQTTINDEETRHIGKHTFDAENINLGQIRKCLVE